MPKTISYAKHEAALKKVEAQRDALATRLNRALLLFRYFDLDPTEVIERGAKPEVFIQFRQDIRDARELVKERSNDYFHRPVSSVLADKPQSFTDQVQLEKKPYHKDVFSLADLARFIRESGVNRVNVNTNRSED